jgi:hypothetical protein
VAVAAASLLVNPTGSDNNYTVTAVATGAAGDHISHEIATPAAAAVTAVAVTAKAIVVTPGTKARMLISGTTPAVGATLLHAVLGEGLYLWTSDGAASYGYGSILDANRTAVYSNGTMWYFWHWDSEGVLDYTATKTSAATSPDGLTGWTVTLGSGSPTIAAAVSSAAQCIAAINADEAAGDLVLAAASGTVTGAVAAVAVAFLTGGIGPSTPPVVFAP